MYDDYASDEYVIIKYAIDKYEIGETQGEQGWWNLACKSHCTL